MVESYHLRREYVGHKMASVLRSRISKTWSNIADTIAKFNAQRESLRTILDDDDLLPPVANRQDIEDLNGPFWQALMLWRGTEIQAVNPRTTVALTCLRQNMRASEEIQHLKHEAKNLARWIYDEHDALISAVEQKLITEDHSLYVDNVQLLTEMEFYFGKSVEWLKALVRHTDVELAQFPSTAEDFSISSDSSVSDDSDSD